MAARGRGEGFFVRGGEVWRFGGLEVWKAACCIDFVRVVNGFLSGSMVETIKNGGAGRMSLRFNQPSAPTLTCCCGCGVARGRQCELWKTTSNQTCMKLLA